MWIAIEGLPAAGKTTGVNLICAEKGFYNIPEIVLQKNGRAILSENDCIENDIRKISMVSFHENVIMDRCILSTITYYMTSHKIKPTEIFFLKTQNLLYKKIYSYPDAIFILDISPEESLNRQKQRFNYRCPDNFLSIDFLSRWRDCYVEFATKFDKDLLKIRVTSADRLFTDIKKLIET